MNRRRILYAAAAIVLSGCATASFNTTNKLGPPPALGGANVYVYSFLDLRNSDLGTRMVQEVNTQLVAQLAAHTVTAEVMTYAQASEGKVPPFGTVMVPVGEIVQSNLGREQEFGAEFRLIIMPSQMNLYGATQSYEVNWSLVEIATGETVWSTTMRGDRTVWWSQDEDYQSRAETVVLGVIDQMVAGDLFRRPPESVI